MRKRNTNVKIVGKNLHSLHTLSRHMKIHDDEETKLKDKLDCDFCDKTFTRKHNLKSHILKMHQ